MSVVSLQTIRTELETVLKLLKKPTYSVDLPDTHIYKRFSRETVDNRADETYPKAYLFLDDGTNEKQAAGRTTKTVAFVLVVIIKEAGEGDTDLQDQIDAIVTDVETVIDLNDTLGGTVQDARISAWTTDGGFAAPEAIAIFRVACTYFKNR